MKLGVNVGHSISEAKFNVGVIVDGWKCTLKFKAAVVVQVSVLISAFYDVVCPFVLNNFAQGWVGRPGGLLAGGEDFRPGLNVHSLGVEQAEVSRQVDDAKSDDLARLPVLDFEVEPVCLALRVGVYFQEQAVVVVALQVCRVQIPTFEIGVENNKVSLLNVSWQSGFLFCNDLWVFVVQNKVQIFLSVAESLWLVALINFRVE